MRRAAGLIASKADSLEAYASKIGVRTFVRTPTCVTTFARTTTPRELLTRRFSSLRCTAAVLAVFRFREFPITSGADRRNNSKQISRITLVCQLHCLSSSGNEIRKSQKS